MSTLTNNPTKPVKLLHPVAVAWFVTGVLMVILFWVINPQIEFAKHQVETIAVSIVIATILLSIIEHFVEMLNTKKGVKTFIVLNIVLGIGFAVGAVMCGVTTFAIYLGCIAIVSIVLAISTAF